MAKQIGEGANGLIHVQPDGNVIKRLKDYGDAESLQSFRREIALLSRLSHEHIVRGAGLDLHTTSAMPVLAMPYHRGGTLQTLLMKQMSTSSRQYAYSDALRFSAQLASALAYLHAQSPAIVFRDLSAANVVLTSTVTREADIKLIDFGLHKLMPAAKLLTLTEGKRPDRGPNRMRTDSAMLYMRADSSRGAPMASAMTGETGSYTYMAPEVTRHEPYNEKVDVYSLGCLLHELFTRELRCAVIASQRPDDSEDAMRAYALKVAGGYRPGMPKAFPEPLARLITSCWAQSPVDRPSCAEVQHQLELMRDTGALDSMDARSRSGGLFACFGSASAAASPSWASAAQYC